MKLHLYIISISFALLLGCKEDSVQETNQVFSLLSSAETHINFENPIVETKDINIYKYGYLYNGGGVGLGDINNDGLPDVYLSSTQGKDKLYLNKGNFEFEDISTNSGIDAFNGYKAGVNIIDINNDGWNDIYVCRQGMNNNRDEIRNLLFINNKDNTFTESAKEYGIDDNGYGTQAGFFDLENDGDLDLYIINHPGEFEQPLPLMISKVNNPTHDRSDRLYRNDGGKYVDITEEAGILNYGYGLGLALGDLNQDGFIDIYVANDFNPHDYYYVNQGNGTFRESLKDFFPHCSYFSMGCDLVDLNNDKALDLFVVEMLSESNKRQKTNMAPMDMDRFSYMVNQGLHYQYMRNNMHLNNGNGYFSDIAYYCGLDKTDWSWGTLFGDYDNDGDEDLIVVNGYLNDTQDKDFSKKTNKLAEKYNNRLTYDQIAPLLQSTPIRNYAFENIGELKFKKVSSEWGFNLKGFSNGVATGDLDNDGDLDVVINNINQEASVYKNNTNSTNFVGVRLIGPKDNLAGLGATLELTTNKKTRYKQFQISRGFQSSVDHRIHFGIAQDEIIENLSIKWPDGNYQTFKPKRGEYNEVVYEATNARIQVDPPNPLFVEYTGKSIDYKHVENYYDDYKREVLLPHQLSQLGPCLSKGDINGDGLEDIFVGGANQYSGKIFIQTASERFIEKSNPIFEDDRIMEDVASELFDVDGDGDLDLYVGSGGNQFPVESKMYQDRLYLNDGSGNFSKTDSSLPDLRISTGCVVSQDFDSDGDLDLFVGSRLIPGQYPLASQSYLLENDNGTYKNVTEEIAPDFSNAGMVTSAIWTDYNQDGSIDLITVGEWTDILFYKHENDNFTLDKGAMEGRQVGWWNTIEEADLDNDGDNDYVVGNLGLNYKYQASNEKPFVVYSNDFDDNGSLDIVLGYHSVDKLYPVRGLQCSSEQIPEIKEKFPTYEKFGESTIEDIYGDKIKESLTLEANEFASIILRNENGKFIKEYLPFEAQLAPIKDIEIINLNNDDYLDIIVAGNWFVAEIETPRADNGTGLVLMGSKDNNYDPLSVKESGLFANGDVRKTKILNKKETPMLIIGNNNRELQVFMLNKEWALKN